MSITDGTPPADAGAEARTARFDPYQDNPAKAFHYAASDFVRRLVEVESSGAAAGVRRLLRRPGVQPVMTVTGKFLTGVLDLRAVDCPYLLEFVDCRFERPPDMRQAKLAGCAFDNCWLPGLEARNVHSDNDLAIRSSTVDGLIDLTDADIDGSLLLPGSTLRNPGDKVLAADRLVIAGALLANNLRTEGECRMPGLRAGGNINFSGAELTNPDGYCLDANGLRVGGNLICGVDKDTQQRFAATGWVLLASGRVESDVSFSGALFRPATRSWADEIGHQAGDPAPTLIADRLRVEGNVDLGDELHSTGTVRMVNAKIGGSLWLTNAHVDVSGGEEPPWPSAALHFDGSEISGNLTGYNAKITGHLRLIDVVVRGKVRLGGAQLSNPTRAVILGHRLTVGGYFGGRDITAQGTFVLQGARIGESLDLTGCRLEEPGERKMDNDRELREEQARINRRQDKKSLRARLFNRRRRDNWEREPAEVLELRPSLDLRAAKIGRDLMCVRRWDLEADKQTSGNRNERSFTAHGGVRLNRAEIGREANFDGAVLGSRTRLTHTALDARGLVVPELILTVGRPPVGRIDLRHARCASLSDNAEFWNSTGKLLLEDFRYDALGFPIDVKDDDEVNTRIRWLRHGIRDSYSPGPYDQLAATLRAAGNEEHASTVLVAKHRHRYKALADGYKVLGPGVRLWSWLQYLMVGYGYRPSRAVVWLLALLLLGTLWFTLHPALHEVNEQDHLRWNPFLFNLDLLVPIVDFGNKSRWQLGGASQWIAAAMTSAGWILATTVAAGVTRMLRRG